MDNDKYITLKYSEYLELQEKLEALINLITKIYFDKDNEYTLSQIKTSIEVLNYYNYHFWV